MAHDEHWEGYGQAVSELSAMLERDRPMLAIFQGGPAMAYEANFIHELLAILLTRARGKGQAYEERVKPRSAVEGVGKAQETETPAESEEA